MARRKQRPDKGEDKAQRSVGGLKDPWPSSPRRPPQFVLDCVNHESERRYIVNAVECYAIRKILDTLVGEHEYEPSPLDKERTICFGDIDIKSDQMKEILAYKYTPAEEAFELMAPYTTDIDNFLHGGRMSQRLPDEKSEGDDTPKPKREPKPAREKIDRTGKITVQQLAEEIGIDPRDARAALRKAKVEKPVGGWLGNEEWAKGIRDILKKAKADLTKKGKK